MTNTFTRVLWVALIVVTVFNVLSALAGGVGMLVTNGLGMPLSSLDGSLFSSFLVPSLVLLIIVGGTQVLSAVLLLRRRPSALVWTAVAGFGLVIWIMVETVIIRGFSFLQALYFATGIAQLALVLALLGIVAWIPRAPWGAPAVR